MVNEEKNKLRTLWDFGKSRFYGSYPENVVIKRMYSKVELQKEAIAWINHFREKKGQLKNVKILSGIELNDVLINWIKEFFCLSDYKIESYNESVREAKESSS